MRTPLWFILMTSFSLGALASPSTYDGDLTFVGNSRANATTFSVPPVHKKENMAATLRRFACGLAEKVPHWVKQKLIEAPVSTQCSLALLKMLRGLSDLEPWAVRMFDSTGKIPTGVFTGTSTELGSFDECLATVVRDDSGTEHIRAQYCSLFIRTDKDTSISELLLPGFIMTHRNTPTLMSYMNDPRTPGFRWGVCVVSECKEEELEEIARSLIGDMVTVNVKYCMTDITPGLTTAQVAVVAILATLLVLMVAATFLDMYASDTTKKNANSTYALQYIDSYESTLTLASFLSVDNFFFMSGYLLSYTLHGLKKGRGVLAVIVIIVRRWYRLVLPLVFVACCFSLLPMIATGPTTTLVYDHFYADVTGYWWAFVLNIRNMYEELTHGVSVHTWYISADYQLFLAALLAHQLIRTRAIVTTLAVMCIACCSFTAWQMSGSRYSPVIVQLTETYDDYIKMFTNVYMLPTYHAASFFGGCITFYVVAKFKNEKVSKGVQAMLWAVVISCATACVLYRFEWTRGTKHSELAKVSLAFWDRILWTLSLAAFTFILVSGRGGFVQTMLSATPLAVLSRLSYGIYLIHFPFFLLWKSAVRERLYTNIFNLFSESVPVFVWSCMLALVLFLACEAPVGRLDKILWAKSSLKKKEEQVNEGHDLELPTRHSEAPEETHHR
ncbi:O-acyltransferase like protein isoform X2 [Rhipicephalus microplus]|uniref:O-acyltransferase like protein isoform X2 n=1 Tax=Rhipicephalus microplus TaxID=6941 RepID=UPI003F6AB789